MNFLLSGYYGFHNAGDEAVLAAMLDHLGQRAPDASFTVTAGDPTATEAMHGSSRKLRAIKRQEPRALLAAMRACDVFISGGGSLLQDVTSLRNVIYYTTLLRWAQLSRKPSIFYAQGVGPLRRPLAQRLTRAAVQHARVVTVRDEASRALLQRIGVRRAIEVTADPVWALEAKAERDSQNAAGGPVWGLALRSWPGVEDADAAQQSTRLIAAVRDAARDADATLRFLPLQPERDRPWAEAGGARDEEILDTTGWHPRRFVAAMDGFDLMIAIRLHALIFAAARGVPCVALNYDPKVAALAGLISAPLLDDLSAPELAKLPTAIAAARPLPIEKLQVLQRQARRNAELAVALAR